MIKVLIVDDHELVREGLKKLLCEINEIQIIGEVSSGEQAIEFVRQSAPNVILMDIKMPGMGGLEATRRILRSSPDIQVIGITAYNQEPFSSRLLQAGAQGYLTKDCSVKEMQRAIRKVYAGERYLSPEVAQQLALKHVGEGQETALDKLSEREWQVMLMITSGEKVQTISDRLCLSPKTVNSYRYRLFEKLNVNNDVELTHLAIRHGMLGQELFTEENQLSPNSDSSS